MKTTFNSLLFILFFLPTIIVAQNTITGTVTEQSTSLPLPGVNVVVKGTNQGTATDFDGNYQINASNGDVLEFSYVGYITKEVTYTGQTNINVTLSEDASQLDEVVIIGYGSVKKEDLTGTTDLVTSEDFNKGPILSAQQLIAGKVAGVSVTSASGAPGEGQSITIRGLGSLSLSSEPMIVVDGVPLGGSAGGSRNALNFINPNDIESFVVLKDASSTAIYGSRAANGVILITTKKGKKGEFKFNLNSQSSVYSPINKVDVLGANEFRTLINSLDNPSASELLGNANTDWQNEIYTYAYGSDHNFNATGSAFGVPLRASLGYSNHDGILKGDNFKRTTAALSLTPTLIEDHLKLELNARGMYTENDFANRDAIGSAVLFDPTQSIYDPTSQYAGYFAWLDAGTGNQNSLAPTNPLALIDLVKNTAETRRLVGNAKIDYTIHGFEDLTATINLGLDKASGGGRTITSEFIPTADETFNGSKFTYNNENTSKLFDAYLTYKKSFKEDTHNINAVAGYSYQSFEWDELLYDSEADEDGNEAFQVNKNKSVLLSYFGRLNYDYKGKYLFTASLRADASSVLNPNDRWGYFPSAAVAWKISDEDFMANSGFNLLKLRAGYGEIANVSGLAPYQFLTRYTGSTDTAQYQFGDTFVQTYRPEPVNDGLRWEVGKTFNLGLDFSILNGRISGLVNAYVKKTEDLIASSLVDPFTNFGNRINANIGDMENKGIEFNLDLIPVRSDNFEWSVNYNIAFNDNKVTKLSVDQPVGGISTGVGNNVQVHREGESPFSYLVYEQVYDNNGSPIEGVFVDRNGDNIINDQDKYINKNPYGDILMGLNSNINYKNWDFSIQTRASIGNYMYNDVAASKGILSGATNNNILSNINSDYFNSGFTTYDDKTALSDHFVQEASFFKLDNITLGYRLDNALKDTTMRFYGSLQNVLTVTDYDGLDPEIGGGIDNNFYPRPRTFVLGVNIDF